MKMVSSWRHVPVHPALVEHGFIDFLHVKLRAGFDRPLKTAGNHVKFRPMLAKS